VSRVNTSFFQPCHLRGKAPDLTKEFLKLGFVLGLARRGLTPLVEQCRHAFDGRCLPLAEHIRMDLMTGSDLGDRLLSPEEFLDDLGLKCRCITRSPIFCLDSWVTSVRFKIPANQWFPATV